MAKNVPVYSLKKDETMALPEFFVAEKSLAALAQTFHVQRDRQHPGNAMVRTRAEVAITKKKMYRQKHTGNARHGSAAAPIFVGGGVTHGPRGVKRVLEAPKRIRASAKNAALGLKAANEKVAFLDLAGVKKTSDAAKLISKVKATTAVVALSKENSTLAKFFRNIKGVKTLPWSDINTYAVVNSQWLLVDSSVVEKKAEKKVKQTKK